MKTMDASFSFSLGLVFGGGLFAIFCCILSLAVPSHKGEILFDLLSWPPHENSAKAE
jgi:hypothetical protein